MEAEFPAQTTAILHTDQVASDIATGTVGDTAGADAVAGNLTSLRPGFQPGFTEETVRPVIQQEVGDEVTKLTIP